LENMQEDDGKHQDQVKELTEKTADSLDDLALKMLFVSIQQNNLELCIGYAVKYEFQNWTTMDDLVKRCLSWFRHCYYNDYEYDKTESVGHFFLRGGRFFFGQQREQGFRFRVSWSL